MYDHFLFSFLFRLCFSLFFWALLKCANNQCEVEDNHGYNDNNNNNNNKNINNNSISSYI